MGGAEARKEAVQRKATYKYDNLGGNTYGT